MNRLQRLVNYMNVLTDGSPGFSLDYSDGGVRLVSTAHASGTVAWTKRTTIPAQVDLVQAIVKGIWLNISAAHAISWGIGEGGFNCLELVEPPDGDEWPECKGGEV
tara:strand:- start:153 stop:470 length:318 start_codon:yes stop_codon:yes gene_type:complete